MEKTTSAYIDETVMNTPQPSAFSTEIKKRPSDYQNTQRKQIQFHEESLGLLSFTNTSDSGLPRAGEFSLQTNSQFINNSRNHATRINTMNTTFIDFSASINEAEITVLNNLGDQRSNTKKEMDQIINKNKNTFESKDLYKKSSEWQAAYIKSQIVNLSRGKICEQSRQSKIQFNISIEENNNTPTQINDEYIGGKKSILKKNELKSIASVTRPKSISKNNDQKNYAFDYKRNIITTIRRKSTNDCINLSHHNFNTSKLFSYATDSDVFQHANLVKTNSVANNKIDRNVGSMKNSSSVSTLPLAIQCTKTELIWGCVQLRISEPIDFSIRNKFQQKLKFQILSMNENFKILDDLSEVTVVLNPMEIRRVRIIFTPKSIGAHIAKLHFNPITEGVVEEKNGQKINLYGYGGHSKLNITYEMITFHNGCQSVSLGNIQTRKYFYTKLVIENTGTLAGFASITVVPIIGSNFKNIKITPADISIIPGGKVLVTVTYIPTQQDYNEITTKKTVSKVHEIAQLKVLTGCDIIRARLRRLENLKKTKHNSVDSLTTEQQLSMVYTNESMPKDVLLFTESVTASPKLLQLISHREMYLSVEYGRI